MILQDATDVRLADTQVQSMILNGEVVYDTGYLGDVEYTGQNITAHNSRAGKIKSAILSGQTMINLFNNNIRSNCSFDTTTGIFTSTATTWVEPCRTSLKLEVGKSYTVFAKFKTTSSSIRVRIDTLESATIVKELLNGTTTANVWQTLVVTITPTLNEIARFIVRDTFDGVVEMKDIMLIEGDHTTKNIPYFTGMSSAKLPVLTASNKNLFDEKYEVGSIVETTGSVYSENTSFKTSSYIKINKDVNYIGNFGAYHVHLYDTNKKWLKRLGLNKFVAECDGFIRFSVSSTIEKIQFEKGTVISAYESHKSSNLKALEAVELGGVGTVKDTLNCITGQLTQRTALRAYQTGDETNTEVVTDKVNTRYKLATSTVKTVGLSGDLLSYPTTTHYTCGTESTNSLIPTLTIKVPTNIPKGLARQQLNLIKEDTGYVQCTDSESIRCVE